jgi:hypothetical protein
MPPPLPASGPNAEGQGAYTYVPRASPGTTHQTGPVMLTYVASVFVSTGIWQGL